MKAEQEAKMKAEKERAEQLKARKQAEEQKAEEQAAKLKADKEANKQKALLEAKAKAEAEAKALAEAEKRQKEEEQQKQKDEERKLQLKKQAKAAEEKQQEAERQKLAEEQERQKKLEQERKDAEKLAQESKRISSSPDDKSPPSEENKTEVVVMRRSRAPMHSSSENTIPKHNRHSMAENQIEADGYSRYTSNPTYQQPKRKTLCETGMLTADQLMQQLNEDEKRRKASYSMLMRQGEEPRAPLNDASSYIPSSMSRRDEPVYYGRNSSTRLLHSQSSNVLNKEQDLKDEALAIRLAADIASKRALDDVTKSPNSTSGSSSSRQRIRDILQKQREDQEKRKDDQEVERKVSSAFDPSSRKLLWVFR